MKNSYMKNFRINMKSYRTGINRYQYQTKISDLKSQVYENYNTIQEIEKQEQDMIQKLKTTFMEVQRKHDEINALEKGTAKESRIDIIKSQKAPFYLNSNYELLFKKKNSVDVSPVGLSQTDSNKG